MSKVGDRLSSALTGWLDRTTVAPLARRTYFILEDYNQQMYPWILPEFSSYVMVLCYYDTHHIVTKVEVQ
eukprot:scaffold143925_cov52-Attheya_sp.AAC.2